MQMANGDRCRVEIVRYSNGLEIRIIDGKSITIAITKNDDDLLHAISVLGSCGLNVAIHSNGRWTL